MLGSYKIHTVDYVRSDKISLLVLTMMYTGFWTLIIDGSFINQSILTLFQALTLLFGVYYFSYTLVKNMNIEFDGVYLKKPLTKSGLITLIVWMSFGLSIILSELIRGTSPHVGVMYFAYIPIIFFYIIPRTLHNPIKTIITAVLYSGLIVLALSLLQELPTIGVPYYGITNNPNSMGMVANQVSISSLSLFYMKYQEKNKDTKKIILYALLFFVSILFLIVSESRTSLLVVGSGIFIVFVHGIITRKIKGRHLLFLVILFFYVYQFFLRDYFIAGVFEKFVTFSNSSNLLAGRTGIWGNILTDSSVFGYGFEYFSDYLQIQAHNDIFQFIGMYGIITGFLLMVFLFLTVFLSFRYMIKNREETTAVIPLIFVVAYIVLGMAESVLGFNAKTPTMVYYNIVGILLLYL